MEDQGVSEPQRFSHIVRIFIEKEKGKDKEKWREKEKEKEKKKEKEEGKGNRKGKGKPSNVLGSLTEIPEQIVKQLSKGTKQIIK